MTTTSHGTKRFKDKVALITGGASGIGRATALRLAAEGAEVIIADRNVELGTHAVSQIEQLGGKAVFMQVDLMDDTTIEALGRNVDKRFQALHILVNNAAILRTGRIESGEWLSNWEPETQIGLRSWVLMTQVLLPAIKEEGGAIVNLSSEGGFLGRPGQWIYDAIKAAVVSTTKTMAATCVLILADRGELDLDAPVAKYWPEFAQNGKENVLVVEEGLQESFDMPVAD